MPKLQSRILITGMELVWTMPAMLTVKLPKHWRRNETQIRGTRPKKAGKERC